MYNLIISFVVGLAVSIAVKLTGFPWYAGLIPGTLAFVGTFILLARRIASKIQVISTEAQKELSTQAANPREQKARIDRAVKLLESALVYERWQLLLAPEIHAQIAMIKYMVKDLDGALTHFRKASTRNAIAQAMLAALYYQRKDYATMERTFEVAVKAGKKEGIVWSAYAWCLTQQREKDKALSVMARAVQANPSDEKLKAGLQALQNEKKFKMKAYEPLWWQFGLELPPGMMPGGGGRQVRFMRN